MERRTVSYMLDLLLIYALKKAFENTSKNKDGETVWVKRNAAYTDTESGEKRLNQTQFTMLGMTGSGKTCYLLGMYKKMLGGLKGFSLTTDDDTDVDLRKRYARMSDSSLGQDRFPAGTDQTDFYDFTLEHALSPIMTFRWIDYPGGALDEKTDGDIEQYNQLAEYIKNSSTLFICVDGALLQGDDDNEEKTELVREKCSSLINPFLSRYLKENEFLPPTAIVVTKFDLCSDDICSGDLKEILEEAFNPLFVSGADSNRFITVIPVSIGKSVAENSYKGKLAPTQLQLPIFMGVWFALMLYVTDLVNCIRDKESDREAVIREKDDAADAFFFWRDDVKVGRLRRLAEEIGLEISREQDRYNKALRDSDKLLKELEEKVNLVYFNGMGYESFTRAATEYLDTRR